MGGGLYTQRRESWLEYNEIMFRSVENVVQRITLKNNPNCCDTIKSKYLVLLYIEQFYNTRWCKMYVYYIYAIGLQCIIVLAKSIMPNPQLMKY